MALCFREERRASRFPREAADAIVMVTAKWRKRRRRAMVTAWGVIRPAVGVMVKRVLYGR
ncbi:hypothetical protein ACHAXS_000739 [Conticribra weissflogii]